MDIKNIFFSLILAAFCFTGANAQQSEVKYYFFDSNWEITTSKNYSYYRKVEVNANGNYLNPIVDYYRNGNVQCIIKADNFKLNSGGGFLDSGGKNGEMAYYDASGNMINYRRYANSQLIDNINVGEKKTNSNNEWTTADVVDVLEIGVAAYEIYRLFKGK